MKYISLGIGAIFWCLGGVVLAQNGPKIVIEKVTHDFGTLPNTQVAEHEFEIRNDGNMELHIRSTRASCGCTVAELPSKKIAAGKSVKMKVKLNLHGRRGPQKKTVYVDSNDEIRPSITLTMMGTAVAVMDVRPRQVLLGATPVGEVTERKLVVSSDLKPFKIKQVESSDKNLSFEVKPLGDEGKSYEVLVKLADTVPKGPLRSIARIHTDIEPGHKTMVVVSGTVVGALAVEPKQLVLRKSPKPVSRYIVIKPGHVKKFRIIKAEKPYPEMKVRVFSMGKSGYRMQVSNILANEELDGKILQIHTDSPKMPLIEIPFRVQ